MFFEAMTRKTTVVPTHTATQDLDNMYMTCDSTVYRISNELERLESYFKSLSYSGTNFTRVKYVEENTDIYIYWHKLFYSWQKLNILNMLLPINAECEEKIAAKGTFLLKGWLLLGW